MADNVPVSNNPTDNNPTLFPRSINKTGNIVTPAITIDWGGSGVEDFTSPDFATDAKLDTVITSLSNLLTELQAKADLAETQPVSLASSPIPSGAATEAKQLADNHNVTVTSAPTTAVTNAGLTDLAAAINASNQLDVNLVADSLGLATDLKLDTVITSLSTLLTELQAKADLGETQPVSAASLPLPTGAATSANQGILLSTIHAEGAGYEDAGVAIGGVDVMGGGDFYPILVDPNGHQQIGIVSSALPTGAATSANQLPPSSITAGAKTVAVAGTAETLVAISTPCKKIIMTAEDDNTGKIYYGGASVSSSLGDYLFPAQKITLEIDDVQKIYIDADTSTDGVKFTVFS